MTDAPDATFFRLTLSIIEGITTDAIVPLIQAPGIRRKWDPVRAGVLKLGTPVGSACLAY